MLRNEKIFADVGLLGIKLEWQYWPIDRQEASWRWICSGLLVIYQQYTFHVHREVRICAQHHVHSQYGRFVVDCYADVPELHRRDGGWYGREYATASTAKTLMLAASRQLEGAGYS